MPQVKTPALAQALEAAGIGFDVLDHERTDRATDEARVLGLRPGEVAKTLVVHTPEGYVRVVLAAADRIDLHKVRALVAGGKEARLATEEELERDYPEFELGAVPPVGGRSDRVLVDRRVADLEAVVLEAGAHDQSIRLDARELVRVTRAEVVDVAAD
ncbi:MAG TPA: YbaK/EbsC family protein [Gaiellaceae bacterium]|nr:YbaK/EbsC family protein [Gaiellaceae bacterium]